MSSSFWSFFFMIQLFGVFLKYGVKIIVIYINVELIGNYFFVKINKMKK